MYDLISIGNISVDMYFQGESLTHDAERYNLAIGGKYLTDHFYEGLGGGGANVAIGVKKMGFNSAIVGKIGNNQFKQLIINHLNDHDVSTKLCRYEENYLKISSILLTPFGERTIVNYETPHEHILQTDEEVQALSGAKMVYLSNLPRVSLEEKLHILRFTAKNNIRTVINFGIKDCRRPLDQNLPLLEKADILIVNGHEFAELVKTSYEDIDFKKSISRYLPLAETKIVIVTDGPKGSYGYINGGVVYQVAVPVSKVIDTTGAGDGYTAGFIAGFLKTNNIEESMLSGAKYAVKIIEKVGAN